MDKFHLLGRDYFQLQVMPNVIKYINGHYLDFSKEVYSYEIQITNGYYISPM